MPPVRMVVNPINIAFVVTIVLCIVNIHAAAAIISSNGTLDHDSDQLEVRSNSTAHHECDQIEEIFGKSQNQACRCFDGVPDFDNLNLDTAYSYSDSSTNATQNYHTDHNRSLFGNIWIGCTKSNFPSINQEMISLPDGVILSKLWIWDNMIALFVPSLFSKVRTEKLIFEHNRLFELSRGRQALHTTAPYLRHLVLRNNVIRSINSEIFRDLANLRTLDLSHNTITSLDDNSLGDGMSQLRYLSFENNRISALKGAVFGGLRHLENLNLASNRMTDCGDRSTSLGLRNLRFLNLANNQLRSIPDWLFDQMPNLHVLDLGYNSLSQIGADFRKLHHLKRLYLNNNLFTVLPQFYLPNLQVLNADRNLISQLVPGWSKSLKSLKLLSLASNHIQSALEQRLFTGLTDLNVLSLQNNSISAINDGTFGSPMVNLQKLLLSDNKLKILSPKAFRGLEKLSILNLARNDLQAPLDVDLLNGLHHLSRLYLNRNKLRILDTKFLEALLPIKYVNLAENPWQCDCTTLNFSNWIAFHPEKLVRLEDTVCQSPDRSEILVADFHTSEPVRQACSDQPAPGAVDDPRRGHGPSDVRKINSSSPASNSTWITVLAFVLAISSVLFLLAVAYLFLKDASTLKKVTSISQSLESNLNANKTINNVNYGKINGHFLKRIPSDMVHLISTRSSSITAPLLVDKRDNANDGS